MAAITTRGPRAWSWSYSKLKNFEVCPKRSYHVDIARDVVEEESETLAWGNVVHKAMADRIAKSKPLPPGMKTHEKWCQKILTGPGNILVEQKLAITKDLDACGYFDADTWYRGVGDVIKINGRVGLVVDWKGLAVDTPIPTPSGFTTMGALAVGDMIFGADGRPYPVLGKSMMKHLPCYRITFAGIGSVVCDEEHLWGLVSGKVVPVGELRVGQRIQLSEPIDCPMASLLIDPYLLGLWLADGKHTSGEISKPDAFIWDELVRRGHVLGLQQGAGTGKCRSHTVKGLRTKLTLLNLIGNKHVPQQYMRASIAQRQDLIRGFMDGDGSANHTRNQASAEATNLPLLTRIAEIVRSLGERVSLTSTTKTGFGKVVPAWMINWRPQRFNPFLLPRKADKVAAFRPGGRRYLEVHSIDPIDSVPTQCISVGSPDSMYLCGREYIPTHNTGRILEDSQQLALMAACVFAHHPEVQAVRSEFVWLKENAQTTEIFKRDQMAGVWSNLYPRINALEHAHKTQSYPAKPGGLCRRYCPVTKCPHHGE